MKKTKIGGLFLAGLFLAIIIPVSRIVAQAPVPRLPHAFYGRVWFMGQGAAIGVRVEARGVGVRTGIIANPLETVQAGQYGSAEALAPKLVVQGEVANGTPIEFFVDGVKAQCAQPGGPWRDDYPYGTGEVTHLDLRVGASLQLVFLPLAGRGNAVAQQ